MWSSNVIEIKTRSRDYNTIDSSPLRFCSDLRSVFGTITTPFGFIVCVFVVESRSLVRRYQMWQVFVEVLLFLFVGIGRRLRCPRIQQEQDPCLCTKHDVKVNTYGWIHVVEHIWLSTYGWTCEYKTIHDTYSHIVVSTNVHEINHRY